MESRSPRRGKLGSADSRELRLAPFPRIGSEVSCVCGGSGLRALGLGPSLGFRV